MSDSLALKDVLGLISLLKEKKRCKVVLLLNTEALKDKNAEDFNVQLEKVIDINLVFSPTAQEAVGIAIPKRSTPQLQWIGEYTEALEISNIRTIFKLLRICGRLEEILNGYDERIRKQATQSACLFGFAFYQPNDAPPIKAILAEHSYALYFGDQKDRNPEEIQCSELLMNYGYRGADAFDVVIFESIRSGFYNAFSIKKEADVLASAHTLQDQDAAFSKVWDIYHGSFDDNADAFASELKRSIADYAAAISPANLSASIEVLKKLGHNEGLEEIIKGYIDGRKEAKEFWAGDAFMPNFHARDPDVVSAFSAKAAEFSDDRNLQEVASDIVRKKGWDKQDLEFIDKHSADDFYVLLKSINGDELRRVVYGLTYFRNIGNSDAAMQSITTKAVVALQKIALESPINRLRVERYGITI